MHQQIQPDSGQGIWRYRSLAVIERGAKLPKRCYLCNGVVDPTPLRFVIRWRRPEVGGGSRLPPEEIVVYPYACPKHTSRTGASIVLGSLLGLAGGAVLFAAHGVVLPPDYDYPVLLKLTGAGLLVTGVVAYMAPAPRLVAVDVDHEAMEIKGFGEPFLASLPVWVPTAQRRSP